MKLHRFLFAFLISLAAFQFCFSQEKPKAELFDEFGAVTCEDLIARQDAFIILLQNEPTAIGYAVIYGKKDDSRRSSWRSKRIIDGQTEARGFDEQRLVVIRGKEGAELQIQFWKVPAGAVKPNFNEIEWDFDLSNEKKPFMFSSTGWEEGPCPIGLQLKNYSNYLSANQNARGNIGIFAKSKNEFQKVKQNLLDKLTKDYKVTLKQLRFFYEKRKADFSYQELWLVPQKIK
jgi:hypothetical protein